MIYMLVLKQIHKISAIGMLAVVIGIITLGPAMADKDSSEGHNKIDICHFDKEDGKYVGLSIPEEKAKGHAKNHDDDMIPAPTDGCPKQEGSELDDVPNGKINMDEFMEDLTRHHEIITEITDSTCSPGEMVTGFGPNGELLCSPDNTGDENSFNIISRTETIELASGKSMTKEFSCAPGEIILSGFIEVPPVDKTIFNDGILVTSSQQSYIAVLKTNTNLETVTINVTYLCFSVI
jgi:hypothetical protein